MNRWTIVLGASLCACSLARPTVLVQPVFELENMVFLTNPGSGSMFSDVRFETPGTWISQPPAALQSPIPAPPVVLNPKGSDGGSPYGLGSEGRPVQPPTPLGGPGGGDPGGTPVPLPSGFGLGVSGMLAMAAASRRRRA